MKNVFFFFFGTLLAVGCVRHNSLTDKQSLDETTAAIRAAFSRGDISAVVALHHPNVVKYFGGDNVVTGRVGLIKQLTGVFRNTKVEFVENTVENTIFNDSTAIQTVIFGIRATPKNGGKATIFRGRSMVVYVRYKDSPYGWVSFRE
jgi:ketosteroid isomerase-like protein